LKNSAQNILKKLEFKWFLIGGCLITVAYLTLMPLIFLLWESFHTPGTSDTPSQFTLKNYIDAYSSSQTWALFRNSLAFATGSSIFAFITGTALAWMNERTNTPFKKLFFTTISPKTKNYFTFLEI
jgi:iron(III) transport system permease protein